MFNWLRNLRHERVQESYALLAEGKWAAIRESIRDVVTRAEPLLLVAHFRDTFELLQDKLAEWNIEYEIPAATVSPASFIERDVFGSSRVLLALAELLIPNTDSVQPSLVTQRKDRISIIVCERHPLARYDRQLKQFILEVALPTRTGYFLSLDEPFLRYAIGETAITVMQQLGLNEHDLITSHLLTRRINRFARKLDKRMADEKQATSARMWLELNLQSDPQKDT